MELERKGVVLSPGGEIGAVFNPGAVMHKGEVILLPRVVRIGYKKSDKGFSNYVSEIWIARSSDGVSFKLEEPFILPDRPFDIYGCEDPRIVWFKDRYLITYTALSHPAFSGKGYRIGLASTNNFEILEKHGIIGPDLNDKNTVIFPEEISDKIYMIHRIDEEIYIAWFNSLKDLINNNFDWDNYLEKRENYKLLEKKYEWEALKIGAGPPPIKTRHGWLLIYHGVDKDHIYHVGAALLDLNNPFKVIARTRKPILSPLMEYERIGDIPNVVFPTGAVVINNELFLYYGAADKRIALATINMDELVDYLLGQRDKKDL